MTERSVDSATASARVGPLVRACHPEPTVAVTALAALLAIADGAGVAELTLLVLAVLSGQLVIGWSNDLLDANRDRQAGRTDKPLATGGLGARTVTSALAASAVSCVALSLLLGWAAGAVHIMLVVGSGLAYNAGLKGTLWSWLPYAVAFGSLPTVVTLATVPAEVAPTWMMVVGALLGVGAHLVNALPDLDDDEQTGIRGLPHRLGALASQRAAMAVLVAASVVAHVAPAGPRPWWSWGGLALVLVLAVIGLTGRGKTPFRAAVLIALVDVGTLVLRG